MLCALSFGNDWLAEVVVWNLMGKYGNKKTKQKGEQKYGVRYAFFFCSCGLF